MGKHSVALWAAVASFFGNAVALKIADLLRGDDVFRVGAALLTSVFVAATVYAKQRLDEARKESIEAERKRHIRNHYASPGVRLGPEDPQEPAGDDRPDDPVG